VKAARCGVQTREDRITNVGRQPTAPGCAIAFGAWREIPGAGVLGQSRRRGTI